MVSMRSVEKNDHATPKGTAPSGKQKRDPPGKNQKKEQRAKNRRHVHLKKERHGRPAATVNKARLRKSKGGGNHPRKGACTTKKSSTETDERGRGKGMPCLSKV